MLSDPIIPSMEMGADKSYTASPEQAEKNCPFVHNTEPEVLLGHLDSFMVKSGNIESTECIDCLVCVFSCSKKAISFGIYQKQHEICINNIKTRRKTMSTLVVYFSLEGSTKFIAEKIAETINADIIELKVNKKYPAEGFRKFFWGGRSVIFGEKPELINERIDLNRYERIIIGTPVWAGSYTPPIKSFISQYEIQGKQVALFACHGGGGAGKCFTKLKKALPGNEFICELDFVEPKKSLEENSLKAASWAESLGSKP